MKKLCIFHWINSFFNYYFCLSLRNSFNYRNYKKLSKSKKEKLQTIKRKKKSEKGLEKLFVTTLKLPTITLGFFLSKLPIVYILVSVVTISYVMKKTSCPLPPFKSKKNLITLKKTRTPFKRKKLQIIKN